MRTEKALKNAVLQIGDAENGYTTVIIHDGEVQCEHGNPYLSKRMVNAWRAGKDTITVHGGAIKMWVKL